MCRFLIINSKKETSIREYLPDFTKMCKNSQRWQGDGWGLAFWQDNKWQVYKSTKPVWEDQQSFDSFPESNTFFVHARGSSFGKHKNNLAFNQPLTDKNCLFVFNGFVNGVELPFKINGRIGSEKIFNLVLKYLRQGNNAPEALTELKNTLSQKSKIVEALNIAVYHEGKIHVLCFYDSNPEYFSINYVHNPDSTLICSQSFGQYRWQTMNNNQILSYKLKSHKIIPNARQHESSRNTKTILAPHLS